MPRLHPCSVGCRIKKAVKFTEKKLYKYDIFLILLIEIFSLFICSDENYMLYKFPMLMYTIVYVLLRTIITKADYLKHCTRKKMAYKVISYYFLFGIFSIIFQIGDNLYSTIVNNTLLITTFVLLILSARKK